MQFTKHITSVSETWWFSYRKCHSYDAKLRHFQPKTPILTMPKCGSLFYAPFFSFQLAKVRLFLRVSNSVKLHHEENFTTSRCK